MYPAGEGRHNENIEIVLIDSTAHQQLRIRLLTTATIVEEFKPAQDYFSAQ